MSDMTNDEQPDGRFDAADKFMADKIAEDLFPKADAAPLLTPYKWLMNKHGIPQGATYQQPMISMRQCASWIDEYIQAKIASGELIAKAT